MISEELVSFSFLYIKLFELGVEVAFNHRSAVVHHKVDVTVMGWRLYIVREFDEKDQYSSVVSVMKVSYGKW